MRLVMNEPILETLVREVEAAEARGGRVEKVTLTAKEVLSLAAVKTGTRCGWWMLNRGCTYPVVASLVSEGREIPLSLP